MIHTLSNVQSRNIGDNTNIWQFAIVLEGAIIGSNCNVNCHTFIENDVIIGDNVTIKSGVYLWDGIRIADNVFIGPNVTFTNDKYPRSKVYSEQFQTTIIDSFVSIGAGAIILGGITLGQYCLIGAGAVVTKDIPPNSLVIGNPGRVVSYVDEAGQKLLWNGNCYISNNGKEYYFKEL
ncbi:MAG: acyltransferase [Ferruginibacter sp.]